MGEMFKYLAAEDTMTPLLQSVLTIAILMVVTVVAVAATKARSESYSTGYQIGPHYLGDTTWSGTPYIFTDHMTSSPTDIVYKPPFTQTEMQAHLRATGTDWEPPGGGTYGLPPASDRPDFWAGPAPGVPDLTVHTYHMRNALPPKCGQTPRDQWRTYGGTRGWTFSPYY